jgi:hypothetical protein
MELKEFVKETLIQIIKGVKEAQVAVKEDGGQVNPIHAFYGDTTHKNTVRDSEGQVIHSIEFDVAITVKEDAGVKGGGGLVVGPVVIGTRGEMSEQNTSTNRIKFPVPISYPLQKQK